MSPVVFLLAFLALSLFGALVLWIRDGRRTPRSMEAHMKAFERELDALSPDGPPSGHAPGRRRRTKGPRAG